MNILVIGGGSWEDTSSLGNTFSNLFADWKGANFYNLYFRDTKPNNSVCNEYFKITTKELLKKIIRPKSIGTFFEISENEQSKEDVLGKKEKKAIALIHKYGIRSAYEIEDFLWGLKKWQNEKLNDFIDLANPDVIFTFAAGNGYITHTVEYVKKRTNAKVVLLVADDIHIAYRMRNDFHHKRLREGLDRLMGMADKVYGISQEMCSHYGELYGMEIAPLYKGCTFDNEPMKRVNNPVKLVYAGNLLYGRFDTLVTLIAHLKRINDFGIAVSLDIFSATIITEEQRRHMNIDGISEFHGGISYSEVKKRMSEADIVLHVESFDEEAKKEVRYSFSTKIIDCLQSGSIMMAIGPSGISSIEYSKKIPGAIVIDDVDTIYDVLKDCLSDEFAMICRAAQIREFALKNHSVENVRGSLHRDFESLCNLNVNT